MNRWLSGRRAGVVSIGAAVVLAAGFWVFLFPHTEFKRYVVKTQLSWLLKNIAPPANTTTMDIRTMNLAPTRTTDDVTFAIGQYITTQDLDAVKQHYLVEFPRHKFVYKREARQQDGDVDITFCRTGYLATLNLASNPEIKGMRIYTIFLVKSGSNPC